MERKLNCGVQVAVNRQSVSKAYSVTITYLKVHKDALLDLAVIADQAAQEGYVDENGMVELFITRRALPDEPKIAKGLLGVRRNKAKRTATRKKAAVA